MDMTPEEEWKEFEKKHREALDTFVAKHGTEGAAQILMERWGKINEELKTDRTALRKYYSAQRILPALRAKPQGLTITEIRDVFALYQNDLGLDEHIHDALTVLEERELAQRVSEQTGEGPAERWIARAQND